MKKIYTIFLLLSVTFAVAFAESPKREMRATWLTTVWRNDWPSTTVPDATGSNDAARQQAVNTQKNGLINILDKLQSENINAVFFQIRSMCDAFYPSSYEPWSHFVSATRGSDPGYDPLAFAIDEAHKRGMELHAWINPYRYSSSDGTHGNLPTDYANAHPDWLLDYSGIGNNGSRVKILNPGKPEVVQRISDIVAEVVTNYKVDGIVFDDYFYMSGTTDAMDREQYNAYNPDNLARGDWRRAQVNKMVKTVCERIRSIKPYVTFGISPAGVAASNKAVADKYGVTPSPVGSDWQYNDIFSDPLAWLYEGSVDYISPQIYWTIGSGNDYAKLSQWWSQVANRFGKHFYSSHSLSDMSSSMQAPSALRTCRLQDEDIPETALSSLERAMLQPTGDDLRAAQAFGFSEIGNQVERNRTYDLNGAPGSVFFATAKATLTGFVNYMNTHQFQYKAIPPAGSRKPAEAQTLVENLALSGQTLSWTYGNDNVRYAIYAVPDAHKNDPQVFASSLYLQGMSYTKQYTLPAGVSAATHRIAVSVIDQYGNEYAPRVLGENTATPTATSLINPADNASAIMPVLFSWESVATADSYVWQIARDAGFTDIIASRETVDPNFNSASAGNLQNNIRYFWRVKTRIPNAVDTWSATRSFTGELFQILSPVGGSADVPLSPEFTWSNIGAAADYTLEISANNQFTSLVYSATVQTTGLTVPEKTLVTATTYYARVKANANALQTVSPTISFTIIEVEIPVPQITSPVDESTIQGKSIFVGWQEQAAKGFRIELAPNATFPPLMTKTMTAGAFSYSVQYDNLAEGLYYIRVAAQKKTGFSAYSPTVKVTLTDNTGIDNISSQTLQAYVANGELTVQSECPGAIKVGIYSLTGQLLSVSAGSLQAGNNIIPLNTKALSKGVYLIRLQMEGRSLTLKMIIKS